MDKLVLIDGNSLLNRAFYATPIFTTKDGLPTNALFGFSKFIIKIISDVKPDYMIVTFDLKAPTFRHKKYDLYKATRKPMPDELAAQLKPLKSLLSAMNIAMCELEGYEADDLIGTLSASFDVHSYIYTGDRDSYQLVDDKTDVYFTKSGVTDLLKLSKENFKDVVGITPSQVIDLKSLMGDKSDNIPGVPGVGEKTALNLLSSYGTLNGIYENIGEIKGALRVKLENNKDSAYLSYELATIDRHCPIEVKLEDCKAPTKFSNEVKKLFTEFEFKSLLNLPIFESDEQAEINDDISYPEIIECESIDEVLPILEKNEQLFIDLNQSCLKIYDGNKLYSLTAGADLFSKIQINQIDELLNKIFGNEKHKVVVYDYKWLLHQFEGRDICVKCDVDDVSVLKYIADYFDKNNSLNELCLYYGYKPEYSAFALKILYDKYVSEVKEADELSLYTDIEKPLIKVLYSMEARGVTVNMQELKALSDRYNEKISALSQKIYDMAGCTFNINSPTQLGDVLFTRLGLKAGKKNKQGHYSTSADILEKLADDNEIVRIILNYRTYQKLLSTYLDGISPLIDKKTSKVHTTYNQTITSTGRLSSANPNLQNIPIREDEGRELRKIFVPEENSVFVDADYSQIELRLLAHFSGCKELISAYNNGDDIHSATAANVFGVALGDVTPKMRRMAKAVNFGIIYGISEFGLSKNLNISISEAKQIIENYFKTYSSVKDYMESTVEFARKNGYVSTLTGRKRYIKEINSSNYNLRQFGERAAMNMPLQGSSADIIKIAMISVENALNKANLKTKLIMQVHDELILEAPIEEAEKAKEILKDCMENAVKLNVPLEVGVSVGKNWYEAK